MCQPAAARTSKVCIVFTVCWLGRSSHLIFLFSFDGKKSPQKLLGRREVQTWNIRIKSMEVDAKKGYDMYKTGKKDLKISDGKN